MNDEKLREQMKELTKEEIENIRKNPKEVRWQKISRDYKLPEEFIREFANEISFPGFSGRHKLSEDFIRRFADLVCWYWISLSQKLSEEFIKEFADKVDWWNICVGQNLSESFVREFKDKLNVFALLRRKQQNLSEEFIRRIFKLRKITVEWTGSYPTLCSGKWIITIDGKEIINKSNSKIFKNSMNTARMYTSSWYIPEKGRGAKCFESSNYGLFHPLWRKSELCENLLKAFQENDITLTEDEIELLWQELSKKDFRLGSCGGCI